MTEGASVRLLGPVQFVAGDGSTVDLQSVAQRRLLSVLALAAGTTLRSEYLGELLELLPGALRTGVSRLRGRVGEDAIQTDGVGYRLTCGVDATTFTALLLEQGDGFERRDRLATLDTALAMWNGDALDEFRHESWAQAEAARLEELRGVAIEDRAELLIVRGRGGEAIAALEPHIAANPLRDRSRGLLIKALASEGRQADALRAYQEYRSYLAEETGTEPSALVRSIERRVAAGSFEPGAGETEESPAVDGAGGAAQPIAAPLHGVLARGSTLIGRRRELTWMESELVLAQAGALRVLLLSGEAGIGKTTLMAAFAREQQRDGANAVLYGRCDEAVTLPLEPLRGIVATMVEHAPVAVLRAHCERFGGRLLRLAPHLSQRVWVPPAIATDDATEARYQLFEAVADLLRRLAADCPLILILDDLHWAEATGLLLLRHLGTALRDSPILVVAAYRDTGEHESNQFRSALSDLARLDARAVPLAGFDDDELSRLVAGVVDTPVAAAAAAADVITQLRDDTAGNPLYAAQLVRHLAESGQLVVGRNGVRFASAPEGAVPRSVLDVVWSRVQALGPVTAAVLDAASVLGLEFDEEIVVDIVDPTASEVAVALDAAVDAGLLAETASAPRTLRFTHALVARALYSEIKGTARRKLHRRAARVLQKSGDDLPQSTVVQLARHWALGGDAPAAQRWATVAGDYALEHLAPIEAAAWFRTALEHAVAARQPEDQRCALMARLGEAQHQAGDPDAQATLLETARIAQRCGADDVLVEVALSGDRGLTRIGEVDFERIVTLEAALAVVDPDATTARARLLAFYARELVHTPRSEVRQEAARESLRLVDASDDPALLPQLASALTFALWGPDTLALRRDLAARAVTAAAAIDDPILQFWTSRAEYYVAIEGADPIGAARGLERVRSIAQRIGAPRLRWAVGVFETFDATMAARLDDAERHAEAALDLGTQIGEPDAFSVYVGQLYAMRSFAGRYEELLPLVEEAADRTPEFLMFRLAWALCCAVVGRVEEANGVLRQGADGGFARIPADNYWMTTTIGYAVIAIELQDAAIAAQLFPLLEPYGDQVAFNGATSQGYIGAYLGKLASLLGEHDLADEYLHRSLDVATAFGWEYHRATTLVALVQSRRRRTGALDAEGEAWLDEAEAIAAARGLGIVTAQIAGLRST